MQRPDYIHSYRCSLQRLIETHGLQRALELVVGGQYHQIGILESSALRTLGLQRHHSLIDVGCGSGRLAYALRTFLEGTYLGTDILPEALEYAERLCQRPDWRFVSTVDTTIPAAGGGADFVVFFSVFTHLLDEDIYRFLESAHRACRAGGQVVFSYLDFDCPSHWPIFEATLQDRNADRVLNKFVSKSAIRCWCNRIGLSEVSIYDGPERWINLTEPFTYSDGRRAEGVVEFGQSVAVFKRT